MLTVVRELNRPRYPNVPMRLAAVDAKVEVWNNQVLKLDEQSIGLKGSPTWVSPRYFLPSGPRVRFWETALPTRKEPRAC